MVLVDGIVVGVGVMFFMYCDMVFVSFRVMICFFFVDLGLVLEVGLSFLGL